MKGVSSKLGAYRAWYVIFPTMLLCFGLGAKVIPDVGILPYQVSSVYVMHPLCLERVVQGGENEEVGGKGGREGGRVSECLVHPPPGWNGTNIETVPRGAASIIS